MQTSVRPSFLSLSDASQNVDLLASASLATSNPSYCIPKNVLDPSSSWKNVAKRYFSTTVISSFLLGGLALRKTSLLMQRCLIQSSIAHPHRKFYENHLKCSPSSLKAMSSLDSIFSILYPFSLWVSTLALYRLLRKSLFQDPLVVKSELLKKIYGDIANHLFESRSKETALHLQTNLPWIRSQLMTFANLPEKEVDPILLPLKGAIEYVLAKEEGVCPKE